PIRRQTASSERASTSDLAKRSRSRSSRPASMPTESTKASAGNRRRSRTRSAAPSAHRGNGTSSTSWSASAQRRMTGHHRSERTTTSGATKPRPVRAAVAAGLTLLGENRVQEAATKHDAVAGARWHLVGPLQSNKARLAVELFEAIESVDSIPLADRLDRLVRELRPASALTVYLQVNVDRDPTKAGFEPEEVEPALTAIECLTGIW